MSLASGSRSCPALWFGVYPQENDPGPPAAHRIRCAILVMDVVRRPCGAL
jgi:hypothetical protein